MADSSLPFEPDTSALSEVRHFAVSRARELGATVDLGALEVVVGELAANAAIHQSGSARLDIELRQDGALEISVFDSSVAQPRLIQEDPWTAGGHRGVQLVAALSGEWGVENSPDGKRVWARLDPQT